MKKCIGKMFFFVILFCVVMIPKSLNATTLRDMYSSLNELKNQKAVADNQKKLSQQDYNNKTEAIRNNELKIKDGQLKIEESKNKVLELNEDIDEKKTQINDMLRFTQISDGGNVYLEYVFGASDFVDFIFRSAMVEQLTNNNDRLIKEMNDLINQNIKLQEDIKIEENKLKVLNEKLKKDIIALGNQISQYAEETMTYDEKIQELSRSIKYYEEQKCGMDEDILVCVKMPVAFGFAYPLNSCMTSGYGKRIHPIYKVERFHYGIDLRGSTGTPIHAAAAGIVTAVNRLSTFGNYIVLRHYVNGVKYSTIYMHLNAFNVKIGDVVTTSSIIGFVGSTGDSTGPHLHFGMLKGWYIEEYSGDYLYMYNNIDPTSFIKYSYC